MQPGNEQVDLDDHRAPCSILGAVRDLDHEARGMD
jgi:hypothetical protein